MNLGVVSIAMISDLVFLKDFPLKKACKDNRGSRTDLWGSPYSIRVFSYS